MGPLLCRFSDAGSDDLATRSGDRRPKSAKARNRGKVRSVGRAAGPVSQEERVGFDSRRRRGEHKNYLFVSPGSPAAALHEAPDQYRCISTWLTI